MKVLVIGGTKFFGIPMIKDLLAKGHDVTIATRGVAKDAFGNTVKRIIIDKNNPKIMSDAFKNLHFDIVIDKIAYCSNDIKYAIENIDFDKFIYMSTTAVYDPKTINTKEEDYNGTNKKLIWCNREDASYSEVKRQAENALYQKYSDKNWVAVRYPVVLGKDDYTKRLLFYIENTIKSIPMNIDNLNKQMGYINSDEAGKFLSFLTDCPFSGAINGASYGTISLGEIIEYVENKTGSKAIIDISGENAPYNEDPEFSINTEKADSLGFKFSNLKDWIYDLIDYYINIIK
ncbi:MAG: reductase [Ruminococcus sp.]|nr:reductase [Ruminococcus sp.]